MKEIIKGRSYSKMNIFTDFRIIIQTGSESTFQANSKTLKMRTNFCRKNKI